MDIEDQSQFVNQETLTCDFNHRDQIQWEMGIDEAGRGPVFGSMVYGACVWPILLQKKLSSIGFDDSKKLTPKQREDLFEKIKEMQNQCLIFKVQNLTPQFISNNQLAIREVNLNEISHNSAISLIQAVLDEGYNLKNVYLDTVGPEASYEAKLVNKFKMYPNVKFTVSQKADSKYPVVSAASICAKVTRDHLLTNWVFEEQYPFSLETGSGYPADPVTKSWMEKNFVPVFGYPQLIRFSWSTTTKAMEQRGLTVSYNQEGKVDLQKKINQPLSKQFYKVEYQNFTF